MTALVISLVALSLFAGFIGLTAIESSRGMRLFPKKRAQIDRFAARIFFLITHIDFAAFARHTARQVGEYSAHEVAHLSLVVVRAVERLLTRMVRALRERRAARATTHPSEASSSFIHSIATFKKDLKKGHSKSKAHPTVPAEESVS